MAGRPRFFRAKRVTYFHTSHKSIFDGSETQHVKSDLTASVDGDHKIKADSHHVTCRASFDGALAINGELNLNQGKIVNAENVLRSVKKTVTYSDFTATSRKFPQNIQIYRASPGDTVTNVIANITESFAVASLMGTG